jgi:hypothetical protein
MKPNDPKCTPTLGVAIMRKLRMFGALVGKAKKTPNWAFRIPLEMY